jgi:hypothetical protein
MKRILDNLVWLVFIVSMGLSGYIASCAGNAFGVGASVGSWRVIISLMLAVLIGNACGFAFLLVFTYPLFRARDRIGLTQQNHAKPKLL